MFCPKCGKGLAKDSKVCDFCGALTEFEPAIDENKFHLENVLQEKPLDFDEEVAEALQEVNEYSDEPEYSVSGTYAKIFTQEGLFSGAGRRGRFGYIVVFFITTVLLYYGKKIFGYYAPDQESIVDYLFELFLLLIFCIDYANTSKRFHDMNVHDLLAKVVMFIEFITFFNFYAIGLNICFYVWLIFIEGTKGPNRFGPEPK